MSRTFYHQGSNRSASVDHSKSRNPFDLNIISKAAYTAAQGTQTTFADYVKSKLQEKVHVEYEKALIPKQQKALQEHLKRSQLNNILNSSTNNTANGDNTSKIQDNVTTFCASMESAPLNLTEETSHFMTAFKKNRPFTGGFGRRRPVSNMRERRRDSEYLLTKNNTNEDIEEMGSEEGEERHMNILDNRSMSGEIQRSRSTAHKPRFSFWDVDRFNQGMKRFQDMSKPKMMSLSESDKKLQAEGGNRRNTFKENMKRISVFNRMEDKVVPIRRSYLGNEIQFRGRGSRLSPEISPIKEKSEIQNRRTSKELTEKLINLIYSNTKAQDMDVDKIGQEKFYRELKTKMYRYKSANAKAPIGEGSSSERNDKTIDKEADKENKKEKEKEKQTSEEHIAQDFKNMTEKGVPEWLKDRRDFEDGYKKYVNEKSKRILEICTKTPIRRNQEDIFTVAEWLSGIKFFETMADSLHKAIATCVRYRCYEKGENLCETGDVGDCLYIIYDGLVKCYVNGNEVAEYNRHSTLGQSALQGSRLRTATLTAHVKTDVLRVELADYIKIMKSYVQQEKEEVANFLKSVIVFKKLDHFILKQIGLRMQSKNYAKGEYVYREGESAESFYIIRQGQLKIENILTIEKQNVWPVDKHKWMKSKLERRVKWGDFLNIGEYFGEAELIKNSKRMNSIICQQDSQLLILNKADFFECLTSTDQNKLLNHSKTDLDSQPDVMRYRLIKQEEYKRQIKNAVCNSWSTQLNSLNVRELEKMNSKVVGPIIKRFNNDFNAFIKKNTYTVQITEALAGTNYD